MHMLQLIYAFKKCMNFLKKKQIFRSFKYADPNLLLILQSNRRSSKVKNFIIFKLLTEWITVLYMKVSFKLEYDYNVTITCKH